MKIVITENQYNGLINDLLSKNLISEQKIAKNQVLDVGREQRQGGYEYVIVGGTPKVTPDVGYTFNGVKITTVKVSFYGMEIWAEYSKKAMIREKAGTMVFYAQCGDYSKTTLNSSPNPAKLSQSGGANWAKGNFTTFQKGGLVDRTIRQYCKTIKKPSSEYSGIDLDLKGLFLKNYSYMLSSETYDEKFARQEREYQAHVKQQAAQKAAEADKGYFERLSDAVSKTVGNDYNSWVAQGGFSGTMNNITTTVEADLTNIKNSLIENFDKIMEGLRDWLGGIAGGVVNTILELTGFGALAVSVQWAALLIYDFSKQNWIKFIFSLLGLLTSGKLGQALYKPFQGIWKTKVASVEEGVSTIVKNPTINSIIGGAVETIVNGIRFVADGLKAAGNWLIKTFNITWAQTAINWVLGKLGVIIKALTGQADDVLVQNASEKVATKLIVDPANAYIANTANVGDEYNMVKASSDVTKGGSIEKDPGKVAAGTTKIINKVTGGG